MEWSTSYDHLRSWTKNETLRAWVLDNMRKMQPSRVHLCDGSEEENTTLLRQMVHSGLLIKCDEKLRPNSYLARTSPGDVARVEEKTFICSDNKEDAGPTNNWRDPEAMVEEMSKLFNGCMRGRTMYVIPFCMGPLNSPFSKVGVQLTDSPYVVVNMRIMTRMGKPALDMLEKNGLPFVPCIHSIGVPLDRDTPDSTWPCNEANKYIVHFPEQRRIWSFGSGYGGNALLGKKCLALRIASAIARDEGWLAEHMLIVGITNPKGVKKYFAAAFPSACGKTNFAMMLPTLPGWKVECVGDDIAWIRVGKDGRLWAVNPEAGFFGVAPGTSMKSNPNCILSLKENAIFTNVSMTPEGDVWWEGLSDEVPPLVTNWLRHPRTRDSASDAAHPNSRFTVAAKQCPVMDPDWENPEGVPLSGIIFGGRRSTTVPLVFQTRDWKHGVFCGANVNSETTAAAAGMRGVLRPDPFAMKPFCGYNMGDYWKHWLSFEGRTDPNKLPKIFHVNWFRKGTNGKFLWPGFGDNIRVVEWMFERVDEPHDSKKLAVETPIGIVPPVDAIDVKGLDLAPGAMEQLLKVDAAEWRTEVTRTRTFFSTIGARLPKEIAAEVDRLEKACAA